MRFLLQDGLGDAHDSRQMIASSARLWKVDPESRSRSSANGSRALACGASTSALFCISPLVHRIRSTSTSSVTGVDAARVAARPLWLDWCQIGLVPPPMILGVRDGLIC